MGVRLGGLRAQASQPNFQHRLLDIRWVTFCKLNGIDPYATALGDESLDVFTDCRQSYRRQKVNGRVTLLTTTMLYNHIPLDRVQVVRELFYHMGWPSFVRLDGMNELLPDDWAALTGDNVRVTKDGKRRKRQRKTMEPMARALVGASMSCPEIALVHLTAAYAAESDIFEFQPPDEYEETLEEATDDHRLRHLVVDTSDLSSLRQAIIAANDGEEDAGLVPEETTDGCDSDDMD